MIRRWSCLNEFNLNTLNFNKFFKTHRLAIFKSSVALKRFNYKITKFKRKTLSRWKHRGNWLIYLNILKKWSEDYKFNKQTTKFQYTKNILNNSYFLYNFDYIKKKRALFEPTEFSAIFSVLPRKNYFYYNKFFHNFNFFKYFNIARFYSYNLKPKTPSTILICSEFENSLYINQLSNFSQIKSIFMSFYELSLNHLTEVYKILTILFYLSVIKR